MSAFRRLAVLGFAVLSLAPVSVANAGSFSDQQKSEIQTIVRDYLIQHPEVLSEAANELEKKTREGERESRASVIEKSREALFKAQDQAVVGAPKGKVTLVEFFDYNCGYCRHALKGLTQLIKDEPELRVVLKDFPVLGSNSTEAAQVAIAVRGALSPDKFWDYHQKLLSVKGGVGKEQALAIAKEMGLDPKKIEDGMKDENVRKTLQDNMRLGDQLNLSGTPSYVLGDEVLVGAQSYDELKGKVDNMLKCGKTACTP